MRYPETRQDACVETLHGREIADPYRWLEDADAPEVAAWVTEQRDFAEGVLADLPGRAWFTELLARIVARPRAGMPFVRGERFFLSRIRKCLNGPINHSCNRELIQRLIRPYSTCILNIF